MPTNFVQKQALVELQEALYKSRNETRRWLHCTRRNWIISAIHKYAPGTPAEAALEVGPGSGIYLPVLSKLFSKVIAVDIEHAYLEHVKLLLPKYQNISLLIDDMISSKLADGSFDLVLCSEVIEHTKFSSTMLKEINRILKPGGILILSTPQRYSTLELTARFALLPGIIQLVKWIYNEPVSETGHINLMTDITVKHQLKEACFETLECHKSGLYLPFIAEFFGIKGLQLEQWIEKQLIDRRSDKLLWTQYYVARKSK